MSVFRVILVRIFPHSDWIRGDTKYLSVFSSNAGKCGPKYLRIQIYFPAFGLNTGIYLFIHFIYRRYTILVTYTEIQSISLYSVRMQENADQNISEYRHFLRSGFERNVETIPDLSAAITQDVTAIREIKLLWGINI